MSDPVSHLKQELLAASERQQEHTVLAPKRRRRWLDDNIEALRAALT